LINGFDEVPDAFIPSRYVVYGANSSVQVH